MTKLFLDTEFDGQWGRLISIALASEDGREWYEVFSNIASDDWVHKNVIPKLEKSPIIHKKLQESMDRFLGGFCSIEIVCDWPCDIRYFCELLIIGPGKRIGGDMTFQLWDSPPYPDDPMRHNALVDARMLRDMYMRAHP